MTRPIYERDCFAWSLLRSFPRKRVSTNMLPDVRFSLTFVCGVNAQISPSARLTARHSSVSVFLFVHVRCHLEASKWWSRTRAAGGSRTLISGGLGSYCPAQLRGSSGNGLVKRMNAGRKPCGIKGVRMGAPVRLQKAVPSLRKNAAVERREVSALRHWACAARRLKCYPAPFGAPLPSHFVRSSPLVSEGWKCPALPAPYENRGGGALVSLMCQGAGCLKCESDVAHVGTKGTERSGERTQICVRDRPGLDPAIHLLFKRRKLNRG